MIPKTFGHINPYPTSLRHAARHLVPTSAPLDARAETIRSSRDAEVAKVPQARL